MSRATWGASEYRCRVRRCVLAVGLRGPVSELRFRVWGALVQSCVRFYMLPHALSLSLGLGVVCMCRVHIEA